MRFGRSYGIKLELQTAPSPVSKVAQQQAALQPREIFESLPEDLVELLLQIKLPSPEIRGSTRTPVFFSTCTPSKCSRLQIWIAHRWAVLAHQLARAALLTELQPAQKSDQPQWRSNNVRKNFMDQDPVE